MFLPWQLTLIYEVVPFVDFSVFSIGSMIEASRFLVYGIYEWFYCFTSGDVNEFLKAFMTASD